jgi:deoxyhypusine synthase
MTHKSLFLDAPDIVPQPLDKGMSVSKLIALMGSTSFEARNVLRGAKLFQQMIADGDSIWLGIAGAGIAGGMGGMVISLLEAGYIDVICSTGAQVYHDLHFAFGLPVKSISPHWDDNALRKHGDTRIYDIGIREQETLETQDTLIRGFVRENYPVLSSKTLTSWEFNYALGQWVNHQARYPERSFTAAAARLGVPVFWDSLSNHSIAMNLLRTDLEGLPVSLSAQQDIFDAAAIVYSASATGFVELGGGGPKNFIQQTGPTISQILAIDFEGADRGLQIGTAVEREGSLSSCTFGEAVTWGKYRSADEERLVQIWGEYSIIFPLLSAYVIDECSPRTHTRMIDHMSDAKSVLRHAI